MKGVRKLFICDTSQRIISVHHKINVGELHVNLIKFIGVISV